MRRWALAWVALCAAFALHVIDEATHDFLSWYNPNALAVRARVPWLPVPVFTFSIWITGLTIGVFALAALTPLVRRGRRWLIPVAYMYALIHVANGVGHIAVSIAGGWLAPGVYTAPMVLASALWLVYETDRVRRRTALTGAPVAVS